ncbi:hypothetical protein MKX03_010355 [Papaver bracteatum]|nr:hypothetical protein MKX03_010355 [Papaver bracteatum]
MEKSVMVKKNINLGVSIQWHNIICSVLLLILVLLPCTSAQSDIDDAIALAIQCGYELLYCVIMIILCVITRWFWVTCNNRLTRSIKSAATRKRGLDLKVIETFPVFVHPDVKNTENILECAVCLSLFEDYYHAIMFFILLNALILG